MPQLRQLSNVWAVMGLFLLVMLAPLFWRTVGRKTVCRPRDRVFDFKCNCCCDDPKRVLSVLLPFAPHGSPTHVSSRQCCWPPRSSQRLPNAPPPPESLVCYKLAPDTHRFTCLCNIVTLPTALCAHIVALQHIGSAPGLPAIAVVHPVDQENHRLKQRQRAVR